MPRPSAPGSCALGPTRLPGRIPPLGCPFRSSTKLRACITLSSQMAPLLRLMVAAQLMLSALAPEAWAAAIRASAPTAPVAPAAPVVPRLSPGPALTPSLGAVTLSNPLALPSLAPTLSAPAAPLQAVQSMTPAPAAVNAVQTTTARPLAAPAQAETPQPQETILESAQEFSRELSPEEDPQADQASVSQGYFDGGAKARDATGGGPVHASNALQTDAAPSRSAGTEGIPTRDTGLAPARVLPKAVFLLDVFDQPASDKTVEYKIGRAHV